MTSATSKLRPGFGLELQDMVGIFRIEQGDIGVFACNRFVESAIRLPVHLDIFLPKNTQDWSRDLGQFNHRVKNPQFAGKGLVGGLGDCQNHLLQSCRQRFIHWHRPAGHKFSHRGIKGREDGITAWNGAHLGGDLTARQFARGSSKGGSQDHACEG